MRHPVARGNRKRASIAVDTLAALGSGGAIMPSYQQTYRMQPATVHAPQQSPAQYSRMSVSPISGALGAEVTGAELGECDEATFAGCMR